MGARSLGLVILSAIMQVFCFPVAGPAMRTGPWLSWVALVPFLVVLVGRGSDGKELSLKQAAGLGYGCGVVWYLGNCWWIYQTMYLYGGMEKPVAFVILILFSLYLGLYHGLFAVLVVAARRTRLGVSGALWLAPFLWVAVELARGRVTGFPWDLLGYAQVDNLLVTRLAPVTGVMGISLLLAGVSSAIAIGVMRRKRKGWVWSGVAVSLALTLQIGGSKHWGAEEPARAEHYAVMVQENLSVGAERKGMRALMPAEELPLFAQLSLRPVSPMASDESKPDVVIWPEAPADFQSNDPNFRAALGGLAKDVDAPLIVGSLGVDVDRSVAKGYHLYDSAALFGRDGSYAGRYDKIHLVPWGEYVPYKQFFSFAQKLTAGSGDMDQGSSRSVFRTGGRTYGVFVCYESIFGDEVREFVEHGAEVLVNISDDGWYGDTGAPWQHLNMARMRAIENHRWVLRATNTGVTTSIDPWGRYTETPRHVRVAYELPFGFETGTTFYTRHGDWLGWVCVLVGLGGLFWGFAGGRGAAARL